jgi:hypothetical protein
LLPRASIAAQRISRPTLTRGDLDAARRLRNIQPRFFQRGCVGKMKGIPPRRVWPSARSGCRPCSYLGRCLALPLLLEITEALGTSEVQHQLMLCSLPRGLEGPSRYSRDAYGVLRTVLVHQLRAQSPGEAATRGPPCVKFLEVPRWRGVGSSGFRAATSTNAICLPRLNFPIHVNWLTANSACALRCR